MLDRYDPYFWPKIAGISAACLGVYYFIWKKNSRLANFLVFGAAFALPCSLLDWDSVLHRFFRVSGWAFP